MREIAVKPNATAMVSDEDYEALAARSWRLDNVGYATCTMWSRAKGRTIQVRMQRMVLGAPPPIGKQIDHHDGNKLNNCRENLRLATSSQNAWNSCKRGREFKGIKRMVKNNLWTASIQANRRRRYIGIFKTAVEAAAAYDAAAVTEHGTFSCINGILPEHRALAGRCLLTPEQARAIRWDAA